MKLNSMGALTALLLMSASLAQAQEAPTPVSEGDGPSIVDQPDPPRPGEEPSSFGIFIEPLLTPIGLFEGDVMIGIMDNLAVAVGGQYFNFELQGVAYAGAGVTLGAQIFPLEDGQNFDGFYVYPSFKYFNAEFVIEGSSDVNGNSSDEVADVTYFGPQVLVGYQWDWHPFSLRLGGGLEYSIGEFSSEFSDQSADLSGLDIETDISIGFTF